MKHIKILVRYSIIAIMIIIVFGALVLAIFECYKEGIIDSLPIWLGILFYIGIIPAFFIGTVLSIIVMWFVIETAGACFTWIFTGEWKLDLS